MDKKNNQISSTIAFNSEDDKQHCYETNGANITVQVQPRLNSSSHGSSMVKFKKLYGYKWEEKDYPGRLVAIHKDGKILAYSISVNGRGLVRVIHLGIGSMRMLLKGLSKECLDLEFAHCSRQIIIGFIEETAVHVYKIEVNEKTENLSSVFLLKIESPLVNHVPAMDKIRFCPFVPEENDIEDEFSVLLFVWVRGNKFECYSTKTILDAYGPCSKNADEITEGIVKSYEEDRAMITSVTFSPDGTTLAIGTQDGSIRFYQIYFHEETPRCLHTWNPHDSQAISDFFFLDNHTQPIAGSTLWKYVVTLSNNNTEIKVSSCDSWEILQTIQFKSADGQPLSFKAEIDRTSSYLILSDMKNRQLYILQILKENQLSQNNGDEQSNDGNNGGGFARVFVKSIAEFHLSSTILSYIISNASIRRYKCALSENYLIDELEDYDEENSSIFCVALKLFTIFPDSVQECQILYQTPLNQSAEVLKTEVTSTSSSSEPKSPAPSALPLLNVASTGIEIMKNDLALRTPPQKASQLNLITPDSFSSPVEKPKEVSQEVLSTIFMLAKNNQASGVSHEAVLKLPNCALIEEEKIFQQKIAASETVPSSSIEQLPLNLKSTSGGSSPSREVRDIMLQADSNNEDYYPPDEEDDIDIDESEDKAVLNALNALGVAHFKNIDDDDDDEEEDDGNEEDDEDDEPDVKVTKSKKPDWPQAPQFIDSSNAASATAKQVETLSNRMNQMIEIMEQQSRYIAELRSDIYSLKSQTNAEAVMSQNLITRVEESGIKAVDQNYSKVETLLLNREKHNQRELTESIMKLFQQLSRNQLATTESAVKESVKSVCGNKAFVDGVSQAMLAGTQKSLEQIFRKSLEDIMIPSYEKITHEMFQEMGKVFTQGTKDYTQAFDAYIKQYGAVHYQMTQFGDTIRQIPQQVKQEVKSTYDANVIPVLNSKLSHLKQQLDVFQTKITQDIRELVKKEIQNGFEQQRASLEDSVLSAVTRSQTETPAPPTTFDHQEAIKQYLALGEVNKAFHTALISNDLSLVEFTIEKADFNTVFKPPLQLEQTVLLSLIQQITVDMNRYSEIKNRYLNEAIINLNMQDPITREHSPKILRELYNTLQIYISSKPTNQLTSSIKMIMLAAQTIANM
ncbi:hypothetical protein PVAND_012175 [Polypedilum vanderplanki]|uniref:Enhancer of mRNA-decapping protein 4 WD40 repeat region domain-containing protein n=1 Tax=Polypedilum vanderplanki TaxID=319348 RepID=A0A9J6CLM3_POLVA|nr:hypothetical protein PVAND_012175 [Polypedilum vanderplanki]